jgi:hypothetical protein
MKDPTRDEKNSREPKKKEPNRRSPSYRRESEKMNQRIPSL